MVGAVAMNTVRTFLQFRNEEQGPREKEQGTRYKSLVPSSKPQVIEGYVRFKVLYLKTSDQALKIQIFKQKNQIIREVNLALEKVGYSTRINEVRIKS